MPQLGYGNLAHPARMRRHQWRTFGSIPFHGKDLRELRLVSRYRRKLTASLAGEKNRLHKLLDDAGIRLGGIVADINGVCARKMVEGLIAGGTPEQLCALGKGKLKA